jgi:hypothetical protein
MIKVPYKLVGVPTGLVAGSGQARTARERLARAARDTLLLYISRTIHGAPGPLPVLALRRERASSRTR